MVRPAVVPTVFSRRDERVTAMVACTVMALGFLTFVSILAMNKNSPSPPEATPRFMTMNVRGVDPETGIPWFASISGTPAEVNAERARLHQQMPEILRESRERRAAQKAHDDMPCEERDAPKNAHEMGDSLEALKEKAEQAMSAAQKARDEIASVPRMNVHELGDSLRKKAEQAMSASQKERDNIAPERSVLWVPLKEQEKAEEVIPYAQKYASLLAEDVPPVYAHTAKAEQMERALQKERDEIAEMRQKKSKH